MVLLNLGFRYVQQVTIDTEPVNSPSDFLVLITSKIVQLLKSSQIHCRIGGYRSSESIV